MRISFYVRKEIKDKIEKLSQYSGSFYGAIKDLIRAGLYLLGHGLKPEHIVLLSHLNELPIDDVEKELRSGLDDGIETVVKKLADILDSFILNLVVASEYLVMRYFGKSALKIIAEYRKKFEEVRKEREEKKDILRGIVESYDNLVHIVDPFYHEPVVVKGVTYLRLHGKPYLNYKYTYTEKDLEELMATINNKFGSSDRIYVMFNNVYMDENAIELMDMVK